MFDHISKHREESWKYGVQRSIFDELRDKFSETFRPSLTLMFTYKTNKVNHVVHRTLLRLNVFKTRCLGQFYCSSSVTVVPAQYMHGGIWRLAFGDLIWTFRSEEEGLELFKDLGTALPHLYNIYHARQLHPLNSNAEAKAEAEAVKPNGLGRWIWNLEVPGSNPPPYRYFDLFSVVPSSTPRPRRENIQ